MAVAVDRIQARYGWTDSIVRGIGYRRFKHINRAIALAEYEAENKAAEANNIALEFINKMLATQSYVSKVSLEGKKLRYDKFKREWFPDILKYKDDVEPERGGLHDDIDFITNSVFAAFGGGEGFANDDGDEDDQKNGNYVAPQDE